jgi:integrase
MGQYRRKLATGDRWYYSGQHRGAKYFSKAEFLTKTECKDAERRRIDEIEKELKHPRQKMTLLELCEKRLDFLQSARSKKHYKDNRRMIARILDAWGRETEVEKITRAMCHDFILSEANRMKAEGKSNFHVNASIRYLRSLFNFAVDELEVIEENPTKKLKFYPTEGKLKYIPTDAEIELLMGHSLPHQQKLIVFMLESGARISEALRAVGKDIDSGMNLLTLWTRKKKHGTLTPRRVPLPVNIAPMKTGDGPLFPDWQEQPRFLEKICTRLKMNPVGWHSFRHRYASILAAKGIPLIEIMNLLGHDNIETTQKYLRLLGFTKY